MMGSLNGGRLKAVSRTLILYLTMATIFIGSNGQNILSCTANSLPPSTLGVTTNECSMLVLTDARATHYTLWYKQDNTTTPTTLSVVLGVPKTNNWYGMGFNNIQASMAGTKAIIFWLNPTDGTPHVHTYSLTLDSLAGVNLDETALTYTAKGSPVVTPANNTIYLSFQVEETVPATFTYQNFVLGFDGDVPNGDAITNQVQHEGEISVKVNFVTGLASVTSNNIDSDAHTHGILNIIGWGALLPLGVMTARYARAFDPLWFYAHAGFQISGYAFVLAGFITGFQLLDKLPGFTGFHTHRALAITIFVVVTIQLSAVLLRPKKEQKVRRYWNWQHWWLGRSALVIGAVNIFVGIHLGDAGRDWKVGYGVALGVEGLVALILEAILWINYFRGKSAERRNGLPQTAMTMQREGTFAFPTPNDNGDK